MADPLRRLTKAGVEAFRAYLGELRAGSRADAPRQLLTESATSEPLEVDVEVEGRVFATSLDLARYLTPLLEPVTGAADDVGLWSWLSLYYFDQLCPPDAGGLRQPGQDYRHIPESGYRRGHMHLLGGAVLVYRLHGESAKLLLYTRLHVESDLHHQLASRQTLISNRAILEAASALYLDERTQRPKRGAQAAGSDGGFIRRFITVIQQLDVNFDLYSMTAEGILSLLPAEFDRWKAPRRKRLGRKRSS